MALGAHHITFKVITRPVTCPVTIVPALDADWKKQALDSSKGIVEMSLLYQGRSSRDRAPQHA